MPYVLLTLVLVAADQLVKYLVRANIPLGTSLPFLPGIMELTYWQNTGAAFSLFSEHTWVLTLISAVVSLVILGVLVKRVVAHPFGVAPLSVVLAGAVGNLIDRVAFGYVTDMFNFQFMRFAVFNVADVCVVVGGFAAAAYYLFLYEKLERKGKAQDAHSDPQL